MAQSVSAARLYCRDIRRLKVNLSFCFLSLFLSSHCRYINSFPFHFRVGRIYDPTKEVIGKVATPGVSSASILSRSENCLHIRNNFTGIISGSVSDGLVLQVMPFRHLDQMVDLSSMAIVVALLNQDRRPPGEASQDLDSC